MSGTRGTDLPAAAGWYPDPGGSGSHRWWDGAAWTERTQGPEVTAALPERSLLRAEVWVVMLMGLLGSTVSAVVLLLRYLLTHETATLQRVAIVGHPVVDVVVQVLIAMAQLAPLGVVWYVLRRSSEDLGTIGLTRVQWVRDLGQAVGLVVGFMILAAVIGVVIHGLGIGATSKGAATGLGFGYLPALYATSIRTAIYEEVLVTGYLLHRLRQLGWNDQKSLRASVAVRTGYHVYGGLPLVLFTLVFGTVLGRIWQRTNRLSLVILTHAIYDGALFTLALALGR